MNETNPEFLILGNLEGQISSKFIKHAAFLSHFWLPASTASYLVKMYSSSNKNNDSSNNNNSSNAADDGDENDGDNSDIDGNPVNDDKDEDDTCDDSNDDQGKRVKEEE